MAAEEKVSLMMELTGLGANQSLALSGTGGTTPTKTTGIKYKSLASADTAEALDVDTISTITLLVLRAVDYDLDVDLDFDTAFDADLTVKAGEISTVIPNPAGTVYVKNNGAGEAPNFEYIVNGT